MRVHSAVFDAGAAPAAAAGAVLQHHGRRGGPGARLGRALMDTFNARRPEAVMATGGFDLDLGEVGPQRSEVLFAPQTGRAVGVSALPDNLVLPAAEARVRTPPRLRRVPATQVPTAVFARERASFCAEYERRGDTSSATRDATRACRVSVRRAG